MFKQGLLRKILAITLSILMVTGAVPATAFADSGSTESEIISLIPFDEEMEVNAEEGVAGEENGSIVISLENEDEEMLDDLDEVLEEILVIDETKLVEIGMAMPEIIPFSFTYEREVDTAADLEFEIGQITSIIGIGIFYLKLSDAFFADWSGNQLSFDTAGMDFSHAKIIIDGQGKTWDLIGFTGTQLFMVPDGAFELTNIVFENPDNKTILKATTADVELNNLEIKGNVTAKDNSLMIAAGAGDLTIYNLSVDGGYNIISSAGDVQIFNSNFEKVLGKSVDTRTAVSTRITGSSFKDMDNNSGGAVAVQAGNLVMTDCTFKNVKLWNERASAVYLHETESTYIKNCTFDNAGGGQINIGGYTSGAIGGVNNRADIEIENCYFLNNVGSKYGGAISLNNSNPNLVINQCLFENNSSIDTKNKTNGNTAGNSDGGAIGIFNNTGSTGSVKITNSTFKGNVAEDDAGALFVEGTNSNSRMDISVYNNTFIENLGRTTVNSDPGGAIQVSGYAYAEFVHNTFYKNKKTSSLFGGGGGAIGYYMIDSPNDAWIASHNNLFIENEGTVSWRPNTEHVSWSTNGVYSGDVGLDNGTALDTKINAANAFGTVTEAPTSIIAGSTELPKNIYVLPVIGKQEGTDNGIAEGVAYNHWVNYYSLREDQAGVTRSTSPFAGAVEAVTAVTTFDVTYDLNTTDTVGNQPTLLTETVTAGNTYNISSSTPTRSGYTFGGWTTTDVIGTAQTYAKSSSFTMPNNNITLTAIWTQNGGGGGGGGSTPPPKTPEPKEEELPLLDLENHYAYIIGYPDGTVRPNNHITRAETASVFFRLLTQTSRENMWTKTNSYPDVNTGDWFMNAVSTLDNGNILLGYPDGTFKPNGKITRAEFASIAVRFDTSATGEISVPFTDISGHWAEENIKKAYELGYISGYPDGTFKPNEPITRAEVASLMNNVLNRHVSSEDDMIEGMITFPDNIAGTWYYYAVQEAINSHDYERKADGKNENWLEIVEAPNWALLNRAEARVTDVVVGTK